MSRSQMRKEVFFHNGEHCKNDDCCCCTFRDIDHDYCDLAYECIGSADCPIRSIEDHDNEVRKATAQEIIDLLYKEFLTPSFNENDIPILEYDYMFEDVLKKKYGIEVKNES